MGICTHRRVGTVRVLALLEPLPLQPWAMRVEKQRPRVRVVALTTTQCTQSLARARSSASHLRLPGGSERDCRALELVQTRVAAHCHYP